MAAQKLDEYDSNINDASYAELNFFNSFYGKSVATEAKIYPSLFISFGLLHYNTSSESDFLNNQSLSKISPFSKKTMCSQLRFP